MNQRKVTIYHSQTSRKEYYTTDVEKWGELKALMDSNVGDKTCVLSGSKHVLAVDDAVLPEEPFTVYVYPKESKGGMTKKKVKKVVKKAKKAASKPKVKAKAKPVKKAKKAPAPLSSSEEKKVVQEVDLAKEAESIGKQLKGFR